MAEHPANTYRNRRAKYFAIAQKHNFRKAYYVLEKDSEKYKYSPQDYTGLLSELIFLEHHHDGMDLNPTLDCGDHCDFRGFYEQKQARFDVTSNLDYKKLEDYEPFQKKGKPYYIALIDTTSKSVDRIIDINIPFCDTCGGRLINTVIIGNIEHTRQGTPTQTERIIKVCSNDLTHNIDFNSYEYFVPSMEEEVEYLYEQYGNDNSAELKKKIDLLPQNHGVDNSLFFSKLIEEKIHACAHDIFTMTDKDGDGYWETKLFWTTDLVYNIYPADFGEIL